MQRKCHNARVMGAPTRWLAAPLLAASIAAAPGAELARITDAQIDTLTQSFGATARERLVGWKDVLNSPKHKQLPEREKLALVNDFMARTPFICDAAQWCMEDYWATPLEFLSNEGGDCEDFSIAKYYTLRALDVPDAKLRILYVTERRRFNGAHMVLAYYPTPDAEPLILDNLNDAILPASQREDLQPVLAFNGTGLWDAKERKGRGKVSEGSYAGKAWGDFLSRTKTSDAVRSVTPEQRKTAECQRLIERDWRICR